jgi:hypothetical protein
MLDLLRPDPLPVSCVTDERAPRDEWGIGLAPRNAKALARRGEHTEAELLARQAVAPGDGTEYLNGQGDAKADLAEVLLLDGKGAEAAEVLQAAVERFARKGNRVSARTGALAELRGPGRAMRTA